MSVTRAALAIVLALLSTTLVGQAASPVSSAAQVASAAARSQYPNARHRLPPELNPPGVLPRIHPGVRDAFSAFADIGWEPGASIFMEKAAYKPGGAAPSSIVVADVNGDGKPDVIVLNQCATGDNGNCVGPGVVSVLLGKGNGTFQAAQTYGSGGYDAIQVVVGDINGDGKLDLAVLNTCLNYACEGSTDDGSISILLGNGDGTFQAAQTFDSGFYPSSIAAGDVNGDGKLDLIVSYYCDANAEDCSYGAVDVYLGNGDGTFQAPVDYSSGGYVTEEVILADMNGDGKPDLAVANCGTSNCYGGTVGVLLGNGDGTFQAAQTYSSGGVLATAAAVGDVNGDGKLDLLVDNYCLSPYPCNEPVVGVLLGNGDGTLQPAQTYSAGSYGCGNAGYCPVSITVADVNGDGKLDVVLPWDVLPGNGDGTFQPPVGYSSGGCARGQFALADLNGDGRPDVSVANYYARNGCSNVGVTIFLNVSPWSTATSLVSSVNPSSYGQPLTFMATVTTQGKSTPTGTVTFMDGANVFRTRVLKGGVAAFSTRSLTAGAHSITAQYNGNSYFGASNSSVLSQAVNTAATETSLSSSSNPSNYGQPITLRAVVIPSYRGTPTGTVTFFDGTTQLASATLNNGRASLTISTLAAGDHSLTAVYAGDNDFAPSTSAVWMQTVERSRVAIDLTSNPNPAYVNQPVTFSVIVSGTATTPTGSAAFKQGTTVLATVPLANGQASFTTSFAKAGFFFVVAEYSGDQNYLARKSSALRQAVEQ